MYKKIITNLAMATISSLALTATAHAEGAYDNMNSMEAAMSVADSNFYLETPADVKLTSFAKDVTGRMSVATQITVPANSIVAVNLSSFSYKADANWVCGIRLVDVQDDDLRESDAMDETNYCIRNTEAKRLALLASSNEKNIEAFKNFQKTGQLAELHDLGFMVKNTVPFTAFTVNATNTSQNIISPLKNCSVGCLVATSEYGMRMHPVLHKKRLHKGIDLRAKIGSEVVSVYDGKVLATRTERNRKTGKMKGYGNYVIVIHPLKGVETLYAHLSAFKTKAGIPVSQGQLIALSGNTGIGTAAHLHFEVHVKKGSSYVPVNPRTYVSKLLMVKL